MCSDPVIPHHNRPRRPLHPDLKVLPKRDMLQQELHQIVALLLLDAHNPPRKLLVDIQRLLARNRMRPDQRMDVLDRLAAHTAAALKAQGSLFDGRVLDEEAMEALLEGGRETGVRFGHVAEDGVAAGGGAFEDVEEGRPGGLGFVGDVGVPGGGGGAVGEEGGGGGVCGGAGVSCRP